MNRFIRVLKKVGKVSEKTAEIVAPVALNTFVPELHIAPALQSILENNDPMNPLEALAISVILGTLQTVVKNPAHKAAMQNQLLGVADDIYLAYGLMPAPHNAAAPVTSA